ncbi:MAG: hydroxyacid dehydrogenase [Acetobacteraceae bacterium]|nr:hydroxyacid dehydrogenase [Acetobacteraceae bacterium]
MKVVFHYTAGPALAARLAALPGLDVTICPEADDSGFAAAMTEAEVLWHVLKPCTAAVIAGAPKLRLIQKIGVGVNTIDLPAAASRGIPVCNLPGSNAPAVAEMALLLMLSVLRRLPQLDAGLRKGVWASTPAAQDSFGELGGKTVGLVGNGAVPHALAPVLQALGCTVLFHSRTVSADPGYRRLDDLLAQSDIVSLHIPQTQATAGMFAAQAFARMKPGAILINTARGGLVDEAALLAALQSGHLAGAGLDVFATEPAPADHPLFARSNVVVVPHVAWLTSGTFDRSLVLASENCRRLLAGADLLHRVQ